MTSHGATTRPTINQKEKKKKTLSVLTWLEPVTATIYNLISSRAQKQQPQPRCHFIKECRRQLKIRKTKVVKNWKFALLLHKGPGRNPITQFLKILLGFSPRTLERRVLKISLQRFPIPHLNSIHQQLNGNGGKRQRNGQRPRPRFRLTSRRDQDSDPFIQTTENSINNKLAKGN